MEQSHEDQDKGGGAEKIWEKTRKTFQTATFEATRYKRVVQKKIDLAAVHKKISAAHGELGKRIDDDREAGKEDILNGEDVQELLRRLDGYKRTAALLEQEIEAIKAELPPKEPQETADPPSDSEKEGS